MPIYNAPVKDSLYVLHDVLRVHEMDGVEGYADLTDDLTGSILEEAGKIARDVMLPLNHAADKEGCRLENGRVYTPKGYKEAYKASCEGGWPGLDCDPEYGGQGLPYLVHAAVGEYQTASAMGFAMYQGLTHGAIKAIHECGSDALKATYLPKMVSGEWTGTMNLTEPHCGTDLALLRTKAEPKGDGSFAITGQKIFISAGDQDLTENIIHLVLARLPDAPAGVKGISLFVVPAVMVNEDGSLGARNSASVGNIEHKMGLHTNGTCVMNYDGATGYLVGEPHRGLQAMFIMMNEARIMVGMQGLALGDVAYQNAVVYAKDRRQGRALKGAAEPDKSADTLMVHPDVRRMLMDAKSRLEGARAFYYWCATLIDAEARHADPAEREKAGLMIALLTPVMKAFTTDIGFDVCVNMQQVYGGHGYISEWGMEQFVRDARIAQIYEGTNGVQALDLIGRKLPLKGGAAMQAFFAEVKDFCKDNAEDPALKDDFVAPLKAASKELQEGVMWLMQNAMQDPNNGAAGSVDFLHLLGHVCFGLMWAKMAKVSSAALAAGTDDRAFHETKLITGRYYMQRILPETTLRLARLKTGAAPVMALAVDQF